MLKFFGTIRVHVKCPGLPDAVLSSGMHKETPEKTVKYLNDMAKRRGTGSTYRLATEAEYQAYQRT